MKEEKEKEGRAVSNFSKDDVIDIVRAVKEPTEEEKQKRQKEEELRDRRRKEAILLAKEEEEAIKRRQANCSHTKENGKPSIAGQVHSDGLVHPICLRCQKEFKPHPPAEAVR